MRVNRSFATAEGHTAAFDTGLYSDGNTDKLVGNAFCTPTSCWQAQSVESVMRTRAGFYFVRPDLSQFATQQEHVVPIMFRIERLHTGASKEVTYKKLSEEAQSFLAGVDLNRLSRAFQ